jgi:hypothetical protein
MQDSALNLYIKARGLKPEEYLRQQGYVYTKDIIKPNFDYYDIQNGQLVHLGKPVDGNDDASQYRTYYKHGTKNGSNFYLFAKDLTGATQPAPAPVDFNPNPMTVKSGGRRTRKRTFGRRRRHGKKSRATARRRRR